MKISATHLGDYILLEYENVTGHTLWEDHGHEIEMRCVYGSGWSFEIQDVGSQELEDGDVFTIPAGQYYRFVPPHDAASNLVLKIEHERG